MEIKYIEFILANQSNKIITNNKEELTYYELIKKDFNNKFIKIEKEFQIEFAGKKEFYAVNNNRRIIHYKFISVDEFEHGAICAAFSLNSGYPILVVEVLEKTLVGESDIKILEELKKAASYFCLTN